MGMVRSPKIDRWSSGSHIRERTLQDRRSRFASIITDSGYLSSLCKRIVIQRFALLTEQTESEPKMLQSYHQNMLQNSYHLQFVSTHLPSVLL